MNRGSKTLLLRTGSEAASGPPNSAEDGSLAFTSLATTAPGNYLTVPSIPVYLGLVNIRDDIAPKVAADAAYQNAKENTPHTARMAHDQALAKVMQHLLKDDTQVYKQFVENESFKRFVGDMVYALTSQ
jgi:hypothetical protein